MCYAYFDKGMLLGVLSPWERRPKHSAPGEKCAWWLIGDVIVAIKNAPTEIYWAQSATRRRRSKREIYRFSSLIGSEFSIVSFDASFYISRPFRVALSGIIMD